MRPSKRPKVADENARREIPFKSLSTRTTINPSRIPTSKPGSVCSSSSEEIREPTTPQKVTNRTLQIVCILFRRRHGCVRFLDNAIEFFGGLRQAIGGLVQMLDARSQIVHRFGRERFGIQPRESAIDVLNCPAQLLDQLAARMSQVIHPSRPLPI